MRRMFPPKLRQLERGVFLPLSGVILFALLVILAVLGYDTVMIRLARQHYDIAIDNICKSAARSSTVQRDAAIIFANMVNDLVQNDYFPRTSIADARLIIPTMPVNGDFAYSKGNACLENGTYKPVNPGAIAGNANDLSFSALIGSSSRCNLDSGNDCQFGYDLCPDNSNYREGYPETMESNLGGAGKLVICEFDVDVETIMSGPGPRRIRSRVAWERSVTGRFPQYDSLSITTSRDTSPSLTIAVAPHLTTSFLDERFRLDLDPVISNNQNPFGGAPHALNDVPATPINAFQFRSAVTEYVGTFPNPFPAYYNTASEARVPLPAVSRMPVRDTGVYVHSIPGVTPPGPPFEYPWQADLFVACSNPIVLMRNVFLKQIAEQASRHADLRNNTQVLIVGTQHRHRLATGGFMWTGSASTIPNPPIEVVPFGTDITKEIYQLPYISYYGGATVPEYGEDYDLLADYAPAGHDITQSTGSWQYWVPLGANMHNLIQGFIFPFANPPGLPYQMFEPFLQVGGFHNGGGKYLWPYDASVSEPNPEDTLREYHATVAGQLRNCYHMYHTNGIILHDKVEVDNGTFETYPPYRYRNVVNPTIPGVNTRWDQEIPWGMGAGPNTEQLPFERGCDGTGLTSTSCLNLSELFSILGSIQMCPINGQIIDMTGNNQYPGDGWDGVNGKPPHRATPPTKCLKPPVFSGSGEATQDLRPDLYALLRSLEPTDTTAPIKMPGYFLPELTIPNFSSPLTGTPGGQVWFKSGLEKPFQASAYTKPPHDHSHLLIVTHQRLNPGEDVLLKNLITSSASLSQRPITVVYLPATDADAHDSEVTRMSNAFNVAQPAQDPTLNQLFVFYPDYAGYSGQTFGGQNIQGQAASTKYRNFAGFLVSDTGALGIRRAARNIFEGRILTGRLKF